MQELYHRAERTCHASSEGHREPCSTDVHKRRINATTVGTTGFRAKKAPWYYTPLALVFSFTLIMVSTLIMASHLERLDSRHQMDDSLLLAKEVYRKNVEIYSNSNLPSSFSTSATTNGTHRHLHQPSHFSESEEQSDGMKGREDESTPIARSTQSYQSTDNLKLDFVMSGFPKTGSTSFLHLFQHHNETNVLEKEICTFLSDKDISALSHLLDGLPVKSKTMQRGIKCPVTLWNINGLSKLLRTKKDLKLIIGVRNPVSWFQSFYNYRVTEMHDKNMVLKPPPPHKLISPDSWKGVTTDGSRFDMALMQLGKVELGPNDLTLLGSHRRRVIPQSSLKVFLYTIDQLKDQDEERSKLFHKDLQHFLGLEGEIEHIPVSNVNHFTRENKYPETINICSTKYKKLRSELVKNGKLSNRWIRSKFVNVADVTVGGRNHFLEIINEWERDPCSDLLGTKGENVRAN